MTSMTNKLKQRKLTFYVKRKPHINAHRSCKISQEKRFTFTFKANSRADISPVTELVYCSVQSNTGQTHRLEWHKQYIKRFNGKK